MAVYNVPQINTSELYDRVVSLDLTKLIIRTRYNERNDCWYMTLSDENNNRLIDSLPILSNVINMTGMFKTMPLTMSGDFIAFDTQTARLDCTKENFGNIVKLFYINAV